jgi:hypothetical protein
MSEPTVKKTKNSHLQAQLNLWKEQLDQVVSVGSDLQQKQRLIDAFVRGFVPLDVTEDDILHYETNLLNDDEFFQSLCREMSQCATGERVEEIEGDQKRKATFFLLPPPGICKITVFNE